MSRSYFKETLRCRLPYWLSINGFKSTLSGVKNCSALCRALPSEQPTCVDAPSAYTSLRYTPETSCLAANHPSCFKSSKIQPFKPYLCYSFPYPISFWLFYAVLFLRSQCPCLDCIFEGRSHKGFILFCNNCSVLACKCCLS